MPKFVLTGAGGQLGSAAAAFALQIAKPTDKLVFTTHNKSLIPAHTLQEYESKGVEVLEANYDDQSSLEAAFAGADAVNMISTWVFGERRRQQAQRVLAAAKKAGVSRICYTSFIGAGSTVTDESELPFLPRDHACIEKLIRDSGLKYNIQRNYLYMDNIPVFYTTAVKFCGGKWLTNSAGKRGAYVAREDCGRVLAALLLGAGEPNTVYDVSGPEAVTDEEVFRWMCERTGYSQAELVTLSDDELRAWWAERGLPEGLEGDFSRSPMTLCLPDLLSSGEMVARGFMEPVRDTVEKLTGKKAQGFRDVLLKYEDLFPRE